MDRSTDGDAMMPDLALGTLQSLVDRTARTSSTIREHAGHWVVRRDEMPEGGADVLEAPAVALLVGVQDPDHPLRHAGRRDLLVSLDRYSFDPCPIEAEICWRLDHLTLRVYRAH